MIARTIVSRCLPAVLSITVALLTACGGGGGTTAGTGGGGGTNPPPSTANEWAWISGSSTANQPGDYGTKGVASASNVPGARSSAVSWTDSSGNFWLFGGNGYDAAGTQGALNDLWEFSPTTKEWTWVSGSSAANNSGVYPTEGSAPDGDVPGARAAAVGWTDSSSNLWLFGGYGYGVSGDANLLNDLWEFNTTTKQWTWVAGSEIVNQPGVYGTQGVASAGNTPGARDAAVGWTDNSGNLWLFGGDAIDSSGSGFINDLWEFNTTTKQWTWVGGSDTANQPAVYGTQGVTSASSTPGARGPAATWTDSNGNFWLFGGLEGWFSGSGRVPVLNDLWEFSPATNEWTWVSGSDTANQPGVYGTLGVASASNSPGTRSNAVSWTDSSGHFWLFGGEAIDSSGTYGDIDDLWEFNSMTKQWTWVGGSSTANQPGVYGTQGVATASTIAGARDSAVAWTDSSGNFWLFGGGWSAGSFNDLWRYQP